LDKEGVGISQYIPSKLSYLRWKRGYLPTQAIYFGKSCVGKTTYLFKNLLRSPFSGVCVEMDKQIWTYYSKENVKYYQARAKEVIKNNSKTALYCLIADMVKKLPKKGVFHPSYNYDAPAFGIWSQFLDYSILDKFRLVRLDASEEVRKRNAKKKGVSWERIQQLDAMYMDPPVIDEVITLD
jgi:hypothetical protein